MLIEWLIADVTSVGSPARAGGVILGMILGVFWPVQTAIVAGKPLCDVLRNPLLSPNNFTKIKWLIADATSVGPPARNAT